jgi:hypothetical protein
VVARSERPSLASALAARSPDAIARPGAKRWLVVGIAPGSPGPLDTDVPDLAARSAAALRAQSSLEIAGSALVAALPDRETLIGLARGSAADAAILVRFSLLEEVSQTDPALYLAATATLGLIPWTVARSDLRYGLELVALDLETGAILAAGEQVRSAMQQFTLWQTSRGDLLGWDIGETIGGARRRRRALETEILDTLLAESAAQLGDTLRAPPP